MNTVQYTLIDSNLPGDTPMYQPIMVNQTVLDLDYVGTVVGQATGYPANVCATVLRGLGNVLPTLLSLGMVDLEFMAVTLGMSITTPDPNASWTASNAPFSIRTLMRQKSRIIEQIRPLVNMQKMPYIAKTPVFTRITGTKYQVDNVVPLESAFTVIGENLKLTSGKSLLGWVSADESWSSGDGDSYGFDDVALDTSKRIITSLPYLMEINGQSNPWLKLGIRDDNRDVTYQSPTYPIIYGGVLYLVLKYTPDNYAGISGITKFRFTVTDGVLTVAIKSATAPSSYGAETTISTEDVDIDVYDSDTTPNMMVFYVAPGAIEYYSAAALITPYEIDGFRE